MGAAPVFAIASPVFTSAPLLGLRDADFSTGCSLALGGVFGTTVAAGFGATISGGFGAGRASTFGGSGSTVWTVRPESGVMPPAFGPGAPPSVIIIGLSS